MRLKKIARISGPVLSAIFFSFFSYFFLIFIFLETTAFSIFFTDLVKLFFSKFVEKKNTKSHVNFCKGEQFAFTHTHKCADNSVTLVVALQLKYGFCKKSLWKDATLTSWTLFSSQKGTCSTYKIRNVNF